MPSSALQLADEIAELRREVRSISRGSQLSRSSLVVDGETVTIPGTVRAVGIVKGVATVALDTANGKNTVTYSPEPAVPEKPGKTVGDMWFQRSGLDGGPIVGVWEWTGSLWKPTTFGNEVLDSLTVGKLVSGEIAAGVRIIAGPIDGTHAEMTHTGFRVFAIDPVDGIPNEVIRLGTDTNDYLGVVSQDGELLASIDDTGQVNGQGLNIKGDPVFGGRTLSSLLDERGGGIVGYFSADPPSEIGPVGAAEVGIAEVTAVLKAANMYEIGFRVPWRGSTDNEEARFFITRTNGPDDTDIAGDAPQASASRLETWYTTTPAAGRYSTFTGTRIFNPTHNARYRFLLACERGASAGTISVLPGQQVALWARDLGPLEATSGTFTQGGGATEGGSPPPASTPTQNYYVDLAPAGKASWRGNNSLRTDLPGIEVAQGYDPSGFNGDGKGMWWFNLPNITGTVTRVDVYMYASHWYYNSGGTVIMNISDQRGSDPNFFRLKPDWYVAGYPKPGAKTVTVPRDWWPLFKGTNNNAFNGRAMAITVGPGYGSNLNYYGRISDCRLRIWYTQ